MFIFMLIEVNGQSDGNQDLSVVIDKEFPGGNISVQKISNDTVYIYQDLKDTEGNWFYWNFRLRGGAGKKLVFQFVNPWKDLKDVPVFAVNGPAISYDNGKEWIWLGKESVNDLSFEYDFKKEDTIVQFSMGMPYVEADLRSFLSRFTDNIFIETGILAETKGGRKVERLHLGNIHGNPKYKIILTARHHACEMMTNYVLEGFMETVLGDSDVSRWFQKHVEVMIIPFVDKDGVENGDQGKNRKGRDHNRDYSGESLYESTRAIRAYLPVWAEDKIQIAMDLHCPYISGGIHEKIHIVGGEKGVVNEKVFSLLLEESSQTLNSLPYYEKDNLLFGQSWNTSKNYTKGQNFRGWVENLDKVRLSTTLEFPYAEVSGVPINPSNARLFGKTLAFAMHKFILLDSDQK
ncbi:hypothetical protein GCM10025777_59150 [Membranihabitans marinus]